MKIHGIMLVRNEGDIIRYALEKTRSWCDHVYVFDNGGADETWDLVQ